MKVIFRKFFNFFTQSFYCCHRQKDKTPQKACQIGQQIAQLQGQTAEQEEVPGRAQEDGADVEEADPAASHSDGEHKEGDGHRQPEQQIQQTAPDRAGDAAAYTAQSVIEQSDADAKCRPTQQSGQLAGNGNTHPPNRRAKKPPEARFSS